MVKPLLTGWHEFLQNNLTLKILQNLDENLKNWLTDLSLSSSSSTSSSSGMTNYVNRHNSLDSQLLSTLPLSNNNNNQSISSNQIKPKTIKSEISNQKSKIELQKPFIGSIHLTHSPIQEIETMNASESLDSTTTNNNNLHSGKLHQTIFITTRVIRRHSLPETQLAIRKTFNFSLSNKSSTVVLLKNDTQNILSLHSRNNNNLPVVSANLLQMLYEELKHNNKSNYVLSKIDIKSIPNTNCYKDNKLLEQKVLDLNYDRTLLRFSALAHRRSSAPITEH
ncbi:hypothetical protein Smp_058480 [Schistosoma mansoni]|uniref:hypothetical protein n=1 Tax=Schistosoma mansoni TaxID=6183 RepID=UPI0001A63C63|nr:hypothetical protein Smp_058480 [Schistosoma mansoni]|eukprot:XP_018645868.1 hypothetical protein Smp_058480 [Schistosoma mansoni]